MIKVAPPSLSTLHRHTPKPGCPVCYREPLQSPVHPPIRMPLRLRRRVILDAIHCPLTLDLLATSLARRGGTHPYARCSKSPYEVRGACFATEAYALHGYAQMLRGREV